MSRFPAMPGTLIRATAVDLFCGAGGLTRGLLDAGIEVVAGYDIDEACRYAYERNNAPAVFRTTSVTTLSRRELARLYPPGSIKILVGCAPCQTFSKYTQGQENDADPKWRLLREFGRLVRSVKPDLVSIENVPELRHHEIFFEFLASLVDLGYAFSHDPDKWIVDCADYGVPQRRRRLVIIASRLGPIELIPPTCKPQHHRRVRDVLRGLPPLRAGGSCGSDPLHRCSGLSPTNLERIRASKPGGTWRDWPRHLVAKCHVAASGETYSSVYGRMAWNKPSPTITTQFIGFGNGRFGHPTQHRGLSLREGALLQSFPLRYQFVPPGAPVTLATMGRMIGNAVPVRLGKAIGTSMRNHLLRHLL